MDIQVDTVKYQSVTTRKTQVTYLYNRLSHYCCELSLYTWPVTTTVPGRWFKYKDAVWPERSDVYDYVHMKSCCSLLFGHVTAATAVLPAPHRSGPA